MKRVVIALLVAGLALIAAIFGIGALLPVQHVATVRAEFSAPPEDVFDAISDYRRHPEWRPSVERIEPLPLRNGRPTWQEIGSTGPLPMEMTETDPPHRMVTTILSDGMPFGGRWIYETEPTTEGTTLTITEEGEVYSPLFRFVSRFIMGHHRTATTYLEDLGQRLGTDVAVEVVR